MANCIEGGDKTMMWLYHNARDSDPVRMLQGIRIEKRLSLEKNRGMG